MRFAHAFILAALCTISTLGFADASFDGRWSGAIETPGTALDIVVDLSSDGDVLSGTISIPVQGLIDAELEGVGYDGDTVRFAIPGIPGDPSFEGRRVDEDSIEGTFSQGGARLPFSLARENAAEQARVALDGLDAEIEQALEDFNVPGLGLAVVAGGEVVYARGFGYRDLANERPMTPDTLFAIGSTTKAMTNAVLAMLSDDGIFDWDVPVRTYLPAFAVEDPSISNRITARDMVTHRTGLPRHDLLWYNNNEGTRAELVARLPHLELTADLRERWQYNNLMYGAVGYLTETLTGTTWEQAVRDRLFDPLGMARSNFRVADSQQDDNHALPYRDNDGELEAIPFRSIDLIGPAGSVNSTVNEMTRWLQFNLDGGVFDGERLIDRATLADLHRVQMTMPSDGSESNVPMGYAMGWMNSVYEGHRMLTHGGGIDGFITSVTFYPDDDLGIVAFTNVGSNLGGLVARTAADRILGIDGDDRIAEALEQRERALAAQDEAEERRDAQRVAGTSPSHAIDDYLGTYEHPGYGRVLIGSGDDESDRGLVFTFNGIEAPLEHWHYDVWNGAETEGDPTFEEMKFAFQSNFEGVIDTLVVPMELTASPIEFTKQPDPRLGDADYLARFVGRYESSLSETVQRVTLSGNQLQLVLPGQPVYTLIPQVDDRFAIEGLQGFAVGFETDDDGSITGITFYQPNGVFSSERVEE
jgi:CubicO group peptidase (beta-lactamase class C family)